MEMLGPATFLRSLDSYLDSLSQEDLRAVVLRSIKHLDGAHRTQLALFLGLQPPDDPAGDLDGSNVGETELRPFVESESWGLLRERFAAFLRENPRAIQALEPAAAARILPGERPAPSGSVVAALSKVRPETAALAALVLLATVIPFAAQYARQRSMIGDVPNLSNSTPFARLASIAVPRPRMLAVQRAPAQPRVRVSHATARRHLTPHRSVLPRVALAPVRVRHVRARHVAFYRSRRPRHTRIARAWKFDPKYNPYFNRRRWRGAREIAAREVRDAAKARSMRRPRVIAARPAPPSFAGRARLMVSSYLAAVIAGNIGAALQHLGLPANANPANVSELPIVSRTARARVVGSSAQANGSERVEAEIEGSAGEFFEIFYVARDGPAARIVSRYYIPVNRSAEERAARMLAQDGH